MAKSKNPRKKSSSKGPSKSSTSSRPLHFLTNSRWPALVIFALAFLTYANTLKHDYTQDDAIVIYDNMFVTKGLKGLPGIFSEDTFFGFFKEEGKANLVEGGRYRPFTLAMYALEVQLFAPQKKDANGQIVRDKDGDVVYDPYQVDGKEGKLNTVKFMGHLISVLLYGLTGVVLYFLLIALLGKRYGTYFTYFVAFFTALLFIAHPIHTEAVANIKGRDEIMALLGSLGATWFVLKYAEQKRMLDLIWAGLAFFIALLSKENTITFLGAVPIAFYFFTKTSWSKIISYMTPLLAATVLFLAIRFSIVGWGIGKESMELMNNPFLKIENGQWVTLSFSEKLSTIFPTLGYYLKLLVFPHPLTHDYYPRQFDISGWSNPGAIVSLLLYVGLLVYAFMGWKKKDPISFGILYFMGTLFIVSNIVFAVGTNMSERFAFMPSVGFTLILSILAFRLAKRLNQGKKIKAFSQLQSMMMALGLVVVLFSVKTVMRNTVWKNNFTLFTTDIAVSENSAKLHNAVGGELIRYHHDHPDPNVRQQKLTEATQHLEKALSIHPTFKNSMLQLGNAYNYLQQYEKSVSYYQRVLALDPNDVDAHNNLGITYREAGKYYGEQKGDLATATNYLRKAYELRPQEYETLRLLGVAYGIQGQHNQAVEFFQKAVDVQPQNADAVWNLGNAYFYLGDQDRANALRQRAVQMDPEVANRNQQR